MNDFHDLKSAEEIKTTTVRDILSAVGKFNTSKKYKPLFSFIGTIGELKNKLKI